MDEKNIIAKRVAKEINDGDLVNLGIGIPTLVSNYIEKSVDMQLQSENGLVGKFSSAGEGEENKDITNAGGGLLKIEEGCSFFDTATSFVIIRGGHVDVTVLGALQVDEKGNLSSHIIPGKMVSGMGGAMDLIAGSKKVIIATTHTAKGDKPKILKKCTLPLTAVGKVNFIATELAFIEVTDKGLLLREIAENTTVEEVVSKTEAELIVSQDLKTFSV